MPACSEILRWRLMLREISAAVKRLTKSSNTPFPPNKIKQSKDVWNTKISEPTSTVGTPACNQKNADWKWWGWRGPFSYAWQCKSKRCSRNTEWLQHCVSEGTNKLTVSLLTYFRQMSLLFESATSGELCTWQLLQVKLLSCPALTAGSGKRDNWWSVRMQEANTVSNGEALLCEYLMWKIQLITAETVLKY